MNTGIKGLQEVVVTEEMSARVMKSGELNVYATPCMIALVEETAWKSVAGELEEGQGTVGTLLNVKHVAATPIGMKVHCETILTEIDRRRLVFDVKVYDEAGLIGEGTHERFIVDNQKFQEKADQKNRG